MTLPSWADAALPLAATLVFFAACALISTAGLRASWLARFAIGGMLTIAASGIAGVLFQLIGLSFSWWQIVLVALGFGALSTVHRRTSAAPVSLRPDLAKLGLIGLWAVVLGTVAVIAFAGVSSPFQFAQTYDNNFHLAAIRHILDTGNASSLQLRTLIEPAKTFSFYPAAWHSLAASIVQLTGVQITVASNLCWLAVVGLVWLPGIAWLSQLLLPGRRPIVVAAVALPLGAAFGSFPYALLNWGTLYPTFVAIAVIPVTLGCAVLLWRSHGGERICWAAGALIGALAVTFAQPRALASLAVLLAPLVLIGIGRRVRAGWRAGGAARRDTVRWLLIAVAALLVLAAAAFWVVWVKFDLAHRPLDQHLSGPQALAKVSLLDAIWQVIGQQWLVGAGSATTAPSLLLAALVVVGFVLTVRSRELRWLSLGYLLTALLFVLAVSSDSLVSKLLTAVWYKDSYRLESLLPVLGVPLAALGIFGTLDWWQGVRHKRATDATNREYRFSGLWAVLFSALVLASSTLVLIGTGMTATTSWVFRLDQHNDGSAIVDQQQLEFLTRVEQVVPAGSLLLGDPWDGSGLSGVFADRTPVFPHVNGQWDDARLALAYHLTEINSNPSVCAAVRSLGVHYLIANPHTFGGGDPSGNHFAAVREAVDQGLFEPVLTDGTNTLYEITQCG